MDFVTFWFMAFMALVIAALIKGESDE